MHEVGNVPKCAVTGHPLATVAGAAATVAADTVVVVVVMVSSPAV